MRYLKAIAVVAIFAVICLGLGCLGESAGENKIENIRANVITSFNPKVDTPVVMYGSFVDPMASVIGDVKIANNVYVGPFASIRGDEGQSIYIGKQSNVQDGVVIHGLETEEKGVVIAKNLVEYGGKNYSVYIGKNVSLAHQSQIHGPALVDDDTFIGMQVLVFKAQVGKNCVVEPGAKLLNGVKVPDGRYVPAGMVVTSQDQADKLPVITSDYPMKDLNKGVLHVNEQLAEGYLKVEEQAEKK